MPESSAPSSEFLDLQAAVAGRYSLEREIGRGGMGIVFLARDVGLERPVAIKLLPPHMARDEELRERFLREARTAAQLAHPHIVPIHIVESVGDVVFFVMSLVDGETLAERVARKGVLAPGEAIRMMQEVAWALGYAHGRGVVHRDIKPDNILLEHATGRALVADFGIARVASRTTLSAEGAIVGTVQYMSPEQMGAAELDGGSDIYSLGATVYFALTGSSPVEAPTVPAMLSRLLTDAVSPVSAVRPDLPPSFAGAVMRCLEKSRGARFTLADELASALQDLQPRSALARPELRHFIRELHSAKIILVAGLLGAPLLAVMTVVGMIPPNSWPAVVGVALGSLYISAAALFGLLLSVARARVSRDEVEAALSAELADVGSVPQVANISENSQVRALQVLGAVSIVAAAFSTLHWHRIVATIPPSGRTVWWYGPYAIGAAMSLYGVATLASVRAGRELPRWLRGKRHAGGGIINTWPLRLVRGIVRTGMVRKLFARYGSPAAVRTDAIPTATLLLKRVEDLIGALPAAMQQRLGDVVPVASALERAIAALRVRIGHIDNAMAELSAASGARTEFASARSRSVARLEECVAALELIRTDCLRLTAGLIAADGVTADLANAQALSAMIEADLYGLDEVRRVLE